MLFGQFIIVGQHFVKTEVYNMTYTQMIQIWQESEI